MKKTFSLLVGTILISTSLSAQSSFFSKNELGDYFYEATIPTKNYTKEEALDIAERFWRIKSSSHEMLHLGGFGEKISTNTDIRQYLLAVTTKVRDVPLVGKFEHSVVGVFSLFYRDDDLIFRIDDIYLQHAYLGVVGVKTVTFIQQVYANLEDAKQVLTTSSDKSKVKEAENTIKDIENDLTAVDKALSDMIKEFQNRMSGF